MLRRAFFYWLFPAALAIPAWLFVGFALYGGGAGQFVGVLIGALAFAVAEVVIGGIIMARRTVREQRAVSWRDTGILAGWHLSLVGLGFFTPFTILFSFLAVVIALGAFWFTLWELFTDASRRVRETLRSFEAQAQAQTQMGNPPSGQSSGHVPSGSRGGVGDDFDGDVLIVRENN